jgi:hypothetical protein
MQVLLDRCPLVDPREAGNPYTETYEERHERRLLEGPLRERFMITRNNIRTLRYRITPTC